MDRLFLYYQFYSYSLLQFHFPLSQYSAKLYSNYCKILAFLHHGSSLAFQRFSFGWRRVLEIGSLVQKQSCQWIYSFSFLVLLDLLLPLNLVLFWNSGCFELWSGFAGSSTAYSQSSDKIETDCSISAEASYTVPTLLTLPNAYFYYCFLFYFVKLLWNSVFKKWIIFQIKNVS